MPLLRNIGDIMDKLESTKKEIPRFIITGILAVMTDYCSYLLLINFIAVDVSKGMSFTLGAIVAFIFNKFWTFEYVEKAIAAVIPFILLYTSTLLVNVSLNHLSLIYISELKTVAFLIATSASTILNFLGMKFWVFNSSHKGGTE